VILHHVDGVRNLNDEVRGPEDPLRNAKNRVANQVIDVQDPKPVVPDRIRGVRKPKDEIRDPSSTALDRLSILGSRLRIQRYRRLDFLQFLWRTPMTAAARQVLREAMGLTSMERAELIDALLRSFDPKADDGIADAWRAETESRIDAFEAGELTDDSAQAMFARINRP